MTPAPLVPPAFESAGLWQALARLDRILEKASVAAEAAYGAAAASEPYRGLYVTAADASRMLRRDPGAPLLAGAAPPESLPDASRLPWLARTFGLDPFDVDVVLLALAPEVDTRYERLFAYLHDDVTRKRPTVDLALQLLCGSREAKLQARGRFAPDAPLIRGRLLRIASDGAEPPPLLSRFLELDDPVVRLLTGSTGLDSKLASFARRISGPATHASLGADTIRAMARMARAALDRGEAIHFLLEGGEAGTCESAAAALASDLTAPLIAADVAAMPTGSREFDEAAHCLAREARLQGAVVLLRGASCLAQSGRDANGPSMRSALSGHALVVLADHAAAIPSHTRVAFPPRTFASRREAWSQSLGDAGIALAADQVDRLAALYRLSDQQIGEAAEAAAGEAKLAGRAAALDDVTRSALAQSRRDLGSLARRVTPTATWDSLILPASQKQQLRELCIWARYRHRVFEDWGFDRKLSLGKGASALFSGPPGTGKTMGGEAVARELGLDLYKIDLSQVVSKYIGETEKNIGKLFDEARSSGAILFFDECDALFGKRTQVQDSHDRYANIEISYLLQKMDEHEGVCILATNLRQNLDVAFLRRLAFIVEFPFPGEESRLDIWKSIWPPEVKLARDVDSGFLAARFKIAGGSVKNIALASAFLAASEGAAEISMDHILRAARRELEKSGRTPGAAEFGPFAERMETVGARR